MSIDSDVQEFSEILSAYNARIGALGRLGLTSSHNLAEFVCARLLNALYGWSLRNENAPGESTEAVDLVDKKNRIVVQVTATCSRKKINETLKSDKTRNYKREGYRLKFAFVGYQHDASKVQGRDGWAIRDYHSIGFDRRKDTFFGADLVFRFQELGPHDRESVLELVRGDIGMVVGSTSKSADVSVDSDIINRINAHLKKEREKSLSFKFIGDQPDESLVPKVDGAGFIPNATRMLRSFDNHVPTTFKDFVRTSWYESGQRHLFITGKGGIGKTVALLTFATEEGFLPWEVPTLYLPLVKVAAYSEKGARCVHEYLSAGYDLAPDELEAVEALSRKPWGSNGSGPNVILLLDGYNEVPMNKRQYVDEGITLWADRGGVQVVATSRIGCLYSLSEDRVWRLDLLELSEDDVGAYLRERDDIDIPEPGSKLGELIKTPLMLKVYADVKGFMEHAHVHWIEFEKSDSAGHLMWNYLQVELHGILQRGSGGFGAAAYAASVFLVLPYVCWQMERDGVFFIDRGAHDKYVEEACSYWHKSLPPSFVALERRLQDSLAVMDFDSFVGAQLEILNDETGLLAKSGESYALMHQEFRDALAALHVRNAAEVALALGTFPDEGLGVLLSEDVEDYLADLLREELLDKLWEANRRRSQGEGVLLKHPERKNAVHNLLRIAKRQRNNDYSTLDFSGMDLRGISLFNYRSVDSQTFQFSSDAMSFDNTWVNVDCFSVQSHDDEINSVCFSTDGRLIATGSSDGTVILWSAYTYEQIAVLFHDRSCVRSVCFSPTDGHLLASASDDGVIILWDASRCNGIAVLDEHRDPVSSICFSPDGSLLASGSFDGTVRLWNVSDGKPVSMLDGYGRSAVFVCFSPDGSLLACGSEDLIRLWNVGTLEWNVGTLELVVEQHRKGIVTSSISFLPDGSQLVCGSDDGIHLRNVKTLRLEDDSYGDKDVGVPVCPSPDGRFLASGSNNGGVCLWDAHTLEWMVEMPNDGGWTTSVCFSPDGHLLAAGSCEGNACLWDVCERREVAVLGCHADMIEFVCLSPDMNLLACGYENGTLRLWDANDGRAVAVLDGDGHAIRTICFSPNGRLLAVCSVNGTVGLWKIDAHERRRMATIKGHGCQIRSVFFLPAGRELGTSSDEGTIHL